jgi:hypothetical protein
MRSLSLDRHWTDAVCYVLVMFKLSLCKCSGALYPGVKRSGREAGHSPLSSVDVKNAWSYTSPPPIRLPGVVLS